MTTKEKVQQEINEMPENLLEQVYSYIHSIKYRKNGKKKIHTFKLNGAFDNINIRQKAYE
ncbi:MAG: hypothetical protein GWP06_14005 [Actinobacteria bacterium]|nr:hypothetical protein [Actinomycetota bacterium]